MKRISLDIDTGSARALLWTWFRCRFHFPKSRIKVEQSLSGIGYHIEILKSTTPLENIKARAILGDDPGRLLYAIRRWALAGKEYIDICHDSNGHERTVEIDMENLLEPYKKDVDFILKKQVGKKVGEKVEELVEKIKPELKKLQKEYFITTFAFNTEQLMEKLKKVCIDTAERDKSFRFRIYESFVPLAQYFLAITSKTKDQAFQRGMWFLKKVFTEEDKKNIKKFGKEKYFWVKQKMSK